VANVYPLTSETMIQVGRATAYIFKNKTRRHKIVIGKDTRLSGYMLEQAIASGICSMGVDAILLGPLPTPAIAFITTAMRADAGIVISASHNPYYDNGVKIFAADGYKLPDEDESRIEDMIFSGKIDSFRPIHSEIGKSFRVDDAQGRYIEFCKSTFPKSMTLDGLKIVLDCANGASYKVAPVIFAELGAEVVTTCVGPNGENINKNCGALHPEGISKSVKKEKAHIGVALDGDADRVAIVDENGSHLDGDHIMAICGIDMLEERKLKKKTLVATVMSNFGLDRVIKANGGKVVRTRVGDRYVLKEMRDHGYNFGGESSGHLTFLDYTTASDGIISALKLLSVIQKRGKKLSEIAMVMEKLPQALINVKVHDKKPIEQLPKVQKTIARAEATLGSKGRVLVRYSGTEPLVRILVEGEKEHLIKEIAQDIANSFKKAVA
jgi:phosphoglucosamine mutase